VATGGDSSYPRQLENTAEELGLRERVHFIGWREDMEAVISASDVVILPTHTEGFPRVLLEAMVLHRPVCATPVGGIPEVIIDGETGLLFEVDDDRMLARQIERLVTDSALKDKILERAYEYVLKGFKPDEHTSAVMKVFELAAGGGR
jgi:glycosyltransferase involved in cell wall biosynthesis